MTDGYRLDQRFPRVSFGTSGVRALVADLNADAVAAYVWAFMRRMQEDHAMQAGSVVAVGMDLRPTSPRIAVVVCMALVRLGYRPEFLGALPTPALALYCLSASVPGVMVTGSHIPFDRNGLKFYAPQGEILKLDERAMAMCRIPTDWVGSDFTAATLPKVDDSAMQAYVRRNVDFFGEGSLIGRRIGLYEHSAVGRDLTRSMLERLGATVISLGRSDDFVPIDTEAVGEADLKQARTWCTDHRLDAVVSTDGDGDRPLVFDERGTFVRGDLLGLMGARELGIRRLVVPVSCNTAIERCDAFAQVLRTRIGPPFVIAGMDDLGRQAAEAVAGFEANGGFLLGTAMQGLDALPTRDAMLPMLSVLTRAARDGCRLSALLANLPERHTHSDRIRECPADRSRAMLECLADDPQRQCAIAGKELPPVSVDLMDGVRMVFADDDIVHLRASGNAPELRCYAESESLQQARLLVDGALERIR